MPKKRPTPSKGATPVVEATQNFNWKTTPNPSAPSEKEMNANQPKYCPSQSGIETGLELPPSYSSLAEKLNNIPDVDCHKVDATKTAEPLITESGSSECTQPVASNAYNCPTGLESLVLNDRLIVRPKVDCFQVVPGCEYSILNSSEEVVYEAKEDTNPNDSRSAGSLRFIQILDSNGVVLRVNRHSKTRRSPKQSLEVWTSQGLAGKVELERGSSKQHYQVLDALGNPIFGIQGSFNTGGAPGVASLFGIFDLTGVRVGTITLQAPEIYTGMNYSFGIVFPTACIVKLKATLLGVIFLLDYMYKQTVTTLKDRSRK